MLQRLTVEAQTACRLRDTAETAVKQLQTALAAMSAKWQKAEAACTVASLAVEDLRVLKARDDSSAVDNALQAAFMTELQQALADAEQRLQQATQAVSWQATAIAGLQLQTARLAADRDSISGHMAQLQSQAQLASMPCRECQRCAAQVACLQQQGQEQALQLSLEERRADAAWAFASELQQQGQEQALQLSQEKRRADAAWAFANEQQQQQQQQLVTLPTPLAQQLRVLPPISWAATAGHLPIAGSNALLQQQLHGQKAAAANSVPPAPLVNVSSQPSGWWQALASLVRPSGACSSRAASQAPAESGLLSSARLPAQHGSALQPAGVLQPAPHQQPQLSVPGADATLEQALRSWHCPMEPDTG